MPAIVMWSCYLNFSGMVVDARKFSTMIRSTRERRARSILQDSEGEVDDFIEDLVETIDSNDQTWIISHILATLLNTPSLIGTNGHHSYYAAASMILDMKCGRLALFGGQKRYPKIPERPHSKQGRVVKGA